MLLGFAGLTFCGLPATNEGRSRLKQSGEQGAHSKRREGVQDKESG